MPRLRTLALAALLTPALLAGCQKPAPPPPAAPAFDTSLDMKEMMGHVVDPAAWTFWRASGEVEDAKGEHSLAPKTTEDWEKAESGAAQLAEAGNLLLIPGYARDADQWVKFAKALTERGLEGKAAAEAHDNARMFAAGAAIYQVCTDCHAKYVMPFQPKADNSPGLPPWPDDVQKKQKSFQASGGKTP